MSSTYFKLLILTGLLNAFFLVRIFTYYLTVLLICTENTLWNISRDSTFVELFKKSFTLYVESGKREIVERDMDKLRKEQGEFLVTEDLNTKFYRFIVDHYLCKYYGFSLQHI